MADSKASMMALAVGGQPGTLEVKPRAQFPIPKPLPSLPLKPCPMKMLFGGLFPVPLGGTKHA